MRSLSHPIKLLITSAVVIFLAEALIMAIFTIFSITLPPILEGLVDAAVLILLVTPALYFLMFLPLEKELVYRGELELALKKNQVELEMKIAERTERLQLLNQAIEHSPVSVVITDAKGTIIYVNKKFFELTGYSSEEVIGNNPRILKSGIQNDEYYKQMWSIISSGKTWRGNFSNRKKNGDIYLESASIAAISDPSGQVGHYVAVKEDVTQKTLADKALKKSESRNRELMEHYKRSDAMKELLLDVITHDLKNPAGVISGMTDFLLKSEHQNTSLELIKDASNSLLSVIENAETLSNVVMDEDIEKTNLNLTQLISSVVNEFNHQFDEADMEVVNNLSADLIIQANPIIVEVFRNFISNAIKYAGAGKRLIIQDEITETELSILFKDFGSTIPEDQYGNVFVRSIQLEKGEKRGRGLGLAIVKGIAAAHSGEVGIRPNDPQGNIFFIKIPLGQRNNPET